MEKKAGANRMYTDFEPYCIWHRKEDAYVLDVDLDGFKKEQLKVRIFRSTILTISGERSLDCYNRWSRFSKEIKLADNIEVNDISSKFTRGILSVVMPKKPKTLSMSISLASKAPEMDQTEKIIATEDAGVWRLEIDKSLGVKVGVALVFLLLGFGVCMKCLCGKSW